MEIEFGHAGIARLICECGTGYRLSSPVISSQIEMVFSDDDKEPLCDFFSPWSIRERESNLLSVDVDMLTVIVCKCAKVFPVQALLRQGASEEIENKIPAVPATERPDTYEEAKEVFQICVEGGMQGFEKVARKVERLAMLHRLNLRDQ